MLINLSSSIMATMVDQTATRSSNNAPTDDPGMYCRRCDYPLNDLNSTECPECGRAFSVDRPRTYRKRPRIRWLRGLMRVGFILFVFFATPVAWYGWQTYHFESLTEWITDNGGAFGVRDRNDWLNEHLKAWDLPRLWHVNYVGLDGSAIHDVDLARLRGLTQLEGLRLPHTHVTDAGLVHLAGMTRLNGLRLQGTRVSDAGMVHLAKMTQLKKLQLEDTQVGDAGLVHLAGLTQLEQFYLQSTLIGDAGLVHLTGMIGLEYLNLSGTKVGDKGLVHLKGMIQLEQLYLQGTLVGDAGLVHLRGLARLKWLDLSNTQVGDAGLVHLKSMTQLVELDVTATRVSAEGIKALEKALPNCRILY